MVVVMKERATEAQIDTVIARLIEMGMDVHRSSGATRTVLGVVGAHKVGRGGTRRVGGVGGRKRGRRSCARSSMACRRCCAPPSLTGGRAAPSSRRTRS